MRNEVHSTKKLRTCVIIAALTLIFLHISRTIGQNEAPATTARNGNLNKGTKPKSAAPIGRYPIDLIQAAVDNSNAGAQSPTLAEPVAPDKDTLIRVTRSNSFLALFSTALSLSDDEKQALKKALDEGTDTRDQMQGLTEDGLAKAIGTKRAKELILSLHRIHDIETVQLARKNLLYQLSQPSFAGIDPAVAADIKRLILDSNFSNREELAEKIREHLNGKVTDEIANTIAEPLYLDEPAPVSEGGTELRPADARQFASHVRFLYEALDLESSQRQKLSELAVNQHEEIRLLLENPNYLSLSPAEQTSYLQQFSASQRQKFENGLKDFLTSEQLNRYFRLEGDNFDRADGLLQSAN